MEIKCQICGREVQLFFVDEGIPGIEGNYYQWIPKDVARGRCACGQGYFKKLPKDIEL